jgi:hypothetical protein
MARGPKGEQRPNDPASAAVVTIQIALGEIAESIEPTREKDQAAVSLGKRGGLKGGAARAAALSPERRREIAREAAARRWARRAD